VKRAADALRGLAVQMLEKLTALGGGAHGQRW
jgi:hypothetical protein